VTVGASSIVNKTKRMLLVQKKNWGRKRLQRTHKLGVIFNVEENKGNVKNFIKP
jgi:hypothetical protein